MIFTISLVSYLDQTTIRKRHRPSGLNNRNLFLRVLETEKSQIDVPADCAFCENSAPGLRRSRLPVTSSSTSERKRELEGGGCMHLKHIRLTSLHLLTDSAQECQAPQSGLHAVKLSSSCECDEDRKR